MASAKAPLTASAYVVQIAENHASERGFQFDDSGRMEFRTIAEKGVNTAYPDGIYTSEDIEQRFKPSTIRLTDLTIKFALGALLTAQSVKKGFSKACPLFPFC